MSEHLLRFVRRATLVLIVVLLSVVGAILEHRLRRGIRPELVTVQTEATPPGKSFEKGSAVGVYHGFEFTESLSGKTVFVLRASRTLGFSSGWQDVQNVQLELYRKGVHKGTLTCDAAQFNPQTRDARLRGAVHLTFEGETGFIDTDRGRLDSASQAFTTNASVVFSLAGMVGRAGKAVYLLNSDTLILEHNVVIGQEAGATLNTSRVEYERTTGGVIFPDGCVMEIGGSHIEAPLARTWIDKTTGKVSRLLFDGGVEITGPTGPAGPAFTAWIETIEARSDAMGLWQVAGTTSGRWIEIQVWSADGTDLKILRTWRIGGVMTKAGPVSLECRPIVCLKEIPPEGAPRNGQAQTAKLWFDNGTPGDIQLKGDVRLSSQTMRATASSARLLHTSKSLVLMSNADKTIRGTLFLKDAEITADRIEMSNDEGGTAHAHGNVLGFARRGTGLLGAGPKGTVEPVRFAADALDATRGGDLLHLRKNARLWEGGKLLLADEVISNRAAATLQALGHVWTTFPARGIKGHKGTAGLKPSDELSIVARSLDYDRTSRVAVYKGDVRYTDRARILSSSVLTVHFDEHNAVQTVDAAGNVDVADLVEHRRMSGETAHFDLAHKIMTLKGPEVRLTDARGNVVTGTSLTWNGADGTVAVSGGKNAPSETIIHQEANH